MTTRLISIAARRWYWLSEQNLIPRYFEIA